jgi:hypothetical protein
MHTDPIAQYKNLVSEERDAKHEFDKKLSQLAVIKSILDTAVSSDLPNQYLTEYRRQLNDVTESSKNCETMWRSKAKAAEKALRELGIELQEEVRSAISVLQDYLQTMELRNHEGGHIAFELAIQHLQTASVLNNFIFDGNRQPAVQQAADALSGTLTSAIEQPQLSQSLKGFLGLPAPKDLSLPTEMSEYYSNAKNGFSLKDFGERYKDALESLFAKTEGDFDKVSRYLAHYGLNAGQVTATMVDGLFRNAGIATQSRKVALVGSNHQEYWGTSHIAAARTYLEAVFGLKVLHEKCGALFNTGFSVLKAPAGSTAEYILVLQGMNKERLTEVLQRISHRMKHTPPKWKS